MSLASLALRCACVVALCTATCPARRRSKRSTSSDPPPASCAPPVKVYPANVQSHMRVVQDEWTFSKLARLQLTDREYMWFASLGGRGGESGTNDMPSRLRAEQPTDTGSSEYAYDSSCGLPKLGIRREYRQLSTEQRHRFHNALNKMKSSYPDPAATLSEYDIFVKYHRFAESPAAHFGAAFLGWHREFLWRFESALRTHEAGVFLPYWDTTLDQALPRPSDTTIWTDDYMGNNEGPVTSGSFAHWGIISECHGNGSRLTRNIIAGPSRGGCVGCGYGAGYGGSQFPSAVSYYTAGEPRQQPAGMGAAGAQGGMWADSAPGDPPAPDEYLFSDADIDYVLSKTRMADIATGNNPKFEADHGLVHTYVGGHMGNIECSPSDPIFWLMHSFVDCVWEEFRQNSQRTDRQTEYPTGIIGGPAHAAHAPMLPFWPLVNAHGLSDHYTNYYYRYAPRPRACTQNEHCGSDQLWCDAASCRCRARVRLGGDCSGLPDSACAGRCQGGARPACMRAAHYKKCACAGLKPYPEYSDEYPSDKPASAYPAPRSPPPAPRQPPYTPAGPYLPDTPDYVPNTPTYGAPAYGDVNPTTRGGKPTYGTASAPSYGQPPAYSPTGGYNPRTTHY